MIEVTDNGLTRTFDQHHPLRVLLVDDSEVFVKAAGVFLSDFPYLRIERTVASGREALGATKSLDVDLVVMDFFMREMDGVQVARQIKKRHPSWKIILMSINPTLATKFIGDRSCIDGFVDKAEFGSTIIPLVRSLFAVDTTEEIDNRHTSNASSP